MKPLISVLTVTKDDPEGLNRTVKSVTQQTYGSWELLIADGGSAEDGQQAVAAALKGSEKVRLISSRDHGIFDGMNKLIAASLGEYVLFLNGGDVLADKHVFEDFSQSIVDMGSPELVCGNVRLMDRAHGIHGTRWGREALLRVQRGRMPPHQGMFARRSAFEKIGGFDPIEKIAGDYRWYAMACRAKLTIGVWDRCVSTFLLDGVSSQRPFQQERERVRVLRDVYGLFVATQYALTGGLCRCVRGLGRQIIIRAGLLHWWRGLKKKALS